MSTNPFVIDSNTQESSGNKYIQIFEEKDFIQTDCTISKLELSEDNRYIDIEVTNPAGQTTGRRLYLAKERSAYESDEKFGNAVKVFMGNIANIARRFKGEAYTAAGTNALEIAQKVIADITPLLKSKKVAVMLELNESNNGKFYTNIGSFAPFADTAEGMVVDNKQKLNLAKMKAQATATITPDSDMGSLGTFVDTSGASPF